MHATHATTKTQQLSKMISLCRSISASQDILVTSSAGHQWSDLAVLFNHGLPLHFVFVFAFVFVFLFVLLVVLVSGGQMLRCFPTIDCQRTDSPTEAPQLCLWMHLKTHTGYIFAREKKCRARMYAVIYGYWRCAWGHRTNASCNLKPRNVLKRQICICLADVESKIYMCTMPQIIFSCIFCMQSEICMCTMLHIICKNASIPQSTYMCCCWNNL